MRKIFLSVSMMAAMIFALSAQAAAPTFAGTWSLDKSKSQGLNQRLQGADSVTWNITQDDKTITIDEKVVGDHMQGGGPGGPPPGGGPAGPPPGGGGGGRGFGGGGGGPRSYNLDGSDTSFDMGRAKGVRKASWSSDAKTLELSSKSTFEGPNGEVTMTSLDKLSLSADGKTLTAVRHSESPRGTQDSTLVFTKQ
jgi:hypothetical protein